VLSRRLAAFANASDSDSDMDSKTQKRPDLVRRKAVGCSTALHGHVGTFLITNLETVS
jgi:hypothetical protein